MRWRPMAVADLDAAERIADAVHPDYPEDHAVFAERLRLFPRGCSILGDPPAGYAIAHPWIIGQPVQLNSLLGALPAEPDTLFLHDIALLPSVRGKGDAVAGVAMMEAVASGLRLPTMSLVAVGRALSFWRARGFVAVEGVDVGSYGVGACYMVRGVTIPDVPVAAAMFRAEGGEFTETSATSAAYSSSAPSA